MATNANEEIKIEAPKETMEMAATPAPATAVQAPVTRDQAYANAVEASKRTDANGVTTPAPVTSPVSTPAPTDYKYDKETGKYEAQVPAPVTPAPKVETPKAEAPKQPAPVDFNVSAGREAEIQKNLASITATNPALTQDRAKFDAAFGYQTADAGKKALLDSFYDSKRPKTQDEMYAMLSSGAQIMGEASKTPEFASAKKRFDAVQAYKSFSIPQFSSALAKGTVIPGSQTYKDLMSNPESADKIRKAEAMNRINKKTVADEDKREAVMSEIRSTTFWQAVADGFIDPQEADALMSTPEIVAKQKEIEPLKNKYDELKADYDNIETDTKNEFQASGKSRAYINAKISERRKNTYRDLSVLESRYNNAVGALADMKKTQAEVLSFNRDLWSADKSFERQKELATFQSDLAIDTEAKKFEQKMAQQAAVAKDPTLATQAVIDQYREMGVLAQRSDAEIVADVQAQVAGGKPLGQVLTDLNKAFQSKPEYIAKNAPKPELREFGGDLYRVEGGKLTKVLTGERETKSTQDWTKLDEGTLYNQRTGETKPVSSLTKGASATDLLSVPDGTVIPSRLKETTNPNNGKECAEYVNDVTKLWMGDSFASKVAKTDTQVHEDAAIGNVAVWNPNPKDPKWNKYGHAGIIVGEEGGDWLIKSSNLRGDGAVTTDRIPKKSIYAYNTKVSAKPKATWPADVATFNSLTASERAKKQNDPEYRAFMDKKKAVLSNPDASIYEVMEATAGGKEMGEERLKSLGKFGQALTQVSELQEALKGQTTWPIIWALREYNPYDSSAQALKARMNSLVPNIARGVYGEVGVLTDQDVELYKKTLPNIRSTEDTNKLVLAMTLSAMINGFKTQLQIDGSAGRDVSGFEWTVKQYEREVEGLLNSIGGNQKAQPPQDFLELYNSL